MTDPNLEFMGQKGLLPPVPQAPQQSGGIGLVGAIAAGAALGALAKSREEDRRWKAEMLAATRGEEPPVLPEPDRFGGQLAVVWLAVLALVGFLVICAWVLGR